MNTHRIVVWRRRIGAVSATLGLLVFAVACFIYVRYASNPANLHVQERVQYARAIGLFWTVSFYGAVLLFLLSLFGLGWSRWVGTHCQWLCLPVRPDDLRGDVRAIRMLDTFR
jgi:hypothetical protein